MLGPEVAEVRELKRSSSVDVPAAHEERAPALKRWLMRHLVFVLTVVLPTIVAVIYFGLIASDVYISESQFIVRRNQPQGMPNAGTLGDLLQSTGIAHVQDDSSLVQDFILSRDALKQLDERLGVRKLYSSSNVDIFSRFPGLAWNSSFEYLYQYYTRRISVEPDSDSSVLNLTVHAYTAEDAQRINDLLLELAERMVNTLNDRSRRDLIQFAEQDVKIAEDKAREATLALYAYRSHNLVYDPDKQAEIAATSIARMQEELVDAETQLVQLTRITPSNPQISALKGRIDTLRSAIADQVAKVTSVNGSLSSHAEKMDRLLVDLTFSDKLLGTALASLEAARSQALHQELYLDRLVQPNLPDYPMEPRRVRAIFTVLAVGMILWGVASLVLASIREHAD